MRRCSHRVQVSGFAFDRFTNNTVVLQPNTTSAFVECTTGITPTDPKPAAAAAAPTRHTTSAPPPHPTYEANTYLTPHGSLDPARPFPMHKCAKDGTTFAQWQADGFDRGSSLSNAPLGPAALVGMARRWLQPAWPRR